MKISEMNDDEAAQVLLRAYRGACGAYDIDEHGDHPSRDVNRWIRIAATGGQDDTQPTESERGNAGAQPAQDGRYVISTDGVPRFESLDGRTILTGDAAMLANARRSNPATVRRVANAIKGYDRLK